MRSDKPYYNDTELLQHIAKGDEAAFRVLFDGYKARFYAVAIKMTRSSTIAEEMVQDVFLRIWQSREQLAVVENPESYFFTILYRQVFKHFKKLALEHKLLKLIAESPAFQNITDETILAQESERLINEAVSKLPPQQQLVFKLNKQDGLSRDQIAEMLHISPNTVRNHLAEAFKFIRAYLKYATFLILALTFVTGNRL